MNAYDGYGGGMSAMAEPLRIHARDASSGLRLTMTVDGPVIGDVRSAEEAAGRAEEGNGELWVAPGLIDLQINGFQGYDLNASGMKLEERIVTVHRLARAIAGSGTTRCYPTVITASSRQILDIVTAVRIACEQDRFTGSVIAGIHLEGPYLSEQDGPRGAHPKPWIRDPDWEEFARWREASGDRIRLVTLAPERAGALPFIRRLCGEGITASIGHTAAGHEEIEAAVKAGARMSTHLGNGAHPLLPRHPNCIWSQLGEERLWASAIADGHHLHPSVLKVFRAAKRERLVLVSDAVHLAGLAPGVYTTHVGGKVELLPSRRLQMADQPGLLAGAAVSLLECVQEMARLTDCPLAEALDMASARPAKLAGLAFDGLKPGAEADLILFRRGPAGLSLQQVFKRGVPLLAKTEGPAGPSEEH